MRRLFALKNTMGYGLNALLDFDDPLEILRHLLIGSEGTLGLRGRGHLPHRPGAQPRGPPPCSSSTDLGTATAALPGDGRHRAPRPSSCSTPRR
jgi:D-lactate dehydrogenase